jgi:hypothetical protein
LTTVGEIQEQHDARDVRVDWLIAHNAGNNDTTKHQNANDTTRRLIRAAKRHNIQWIVVFTQRDTSREEHPTQPWTTFLATIGFHTLKARVQAHRYGAAMEGEFIMIIATKTWTALETYHLQHEQVTTLAEHMDNEVLRLHVVL